MICVQVDQEVLKVKSLLDCGVTTGPLSLVC